MNEIKSRKEQNLTSLIQKGGGDRELVYLITNGVVFHFVLIHHTHLSGLRNVQEHRIIFVLGSER
jgi:hypothetical protein